MRKTYGERFNSAQRRGGKVAAPQEQAVVTSRDAPLFVATRDDVGPAVDKIIYATLRKLKVFVSAASSEIKSMLINALEKAEEQGRFGVDEWTYLFIDKKVRPGSAQKAFEESHAQSSEFIVPVAGISIVPTVDAETGEVTGSAFVTSSDDTETTSSGTYGSGEVTFGDPAFTFSTFTASNAPVEEPPTEEAVPEEEVSETADTDITDESAEPLSPPETEAEYEDDSDEAEEDEDADEEE